MPRFAMLARRLMVFDKSLLESDFRHEAAKIRVGLVKIAHDVNNLAIEQSKANEALDLLDLRISGDNPVKSIARVSKKEPLVRSLSDGDHHLVALFPFRDEFRDQVRWRLEVSEDRDERIALGVQHTVMGRAA